MKIDALYMESERKAGIREISISGPKPGQIQVEVAACGVCAWDTFLFKGLDVREPFPFRFGHEAVGVVKELGENVTAFSPSDRVFCIDGGPAMAQVINIDAELVGLLPGRPEKAEDFIPYIGEPLVCVVAGLANLPVRPGDNVAVIGAGYMGLLNIQAYVHSLIGSLDCFDISSDKLQLAKAYGADHCWLSNTQDGAAAAKRIVGRGGVDIAVECSGSQAGLQLAIELTRAGGTVSNFAWHRAVRTLDASAWHTRGIRIINTAPALDRHFSDHVIPTQRLMARGVFDQRRMITHVMNYRRIQEMLEISETKADGYIKGVMTFD